MAVPHDLRRALAAMARPILYGGRRLLERYVLGTRLNEWSWRWRHLLARSVAEDHWASISHPHRAPLVTRIVALAPESILEVGCNAGPNLYLLSKALPAARLYGIDVNANAVALGQQKLRDSGIRNVDLSIGTASRLSTFTDRSVDVVLADAILMYVGPDQIRTVLSELVRVARRAIVLNEWQLTVEETQSGKRHREHFGHWLHDYAALLRDFPRVTRVQTFVVAPEIWRSRGWDEFGVVVEAALS